VAGLALTVPLAPFPLASKAQAGTVALVPSPTRYWLGATVSTGAAATGNYGAIGQLTHQ
jgi:hypothetical protein